MTKLIWQMAAKAIITEVKQHDKGEIAKIGRKSAPKTPFLKAQSCHSLSSPTTRDPNPITKACFLGPIATQDRVGWIDDI